MQQLGASALPSPPAWPPRNIQLTYFDIPGRAEASRLMLTRAKIPFEDKRISFAEWPQLKATVPYGQLPVLEVDGRVLTQSSAINQYVARLTGHYPEDPWLAAQVEEVRGMIEDMWAPIGRTVHIVDPAEKLAARQRALEGEVAAKLRLLDARLAASQRASGEGAGGSSEGAGGSGEGGAGAGAAAGAQGPVGYLVGGRLTSADILLFCALSHIICGFLDGVPRDLYVPYPAICAFHSRMASLPEVKSHYAHHADGYWTAFQPQLGHLLTMIQDCGLEPKPELGAHPVAGAGAGAAGQEQDHP